MNRLTQVAALGAVAFVLTYLEFPLPPIPAFLKYEPGDVPALIAGFALGPLAGLLVEVIKAVLMALFRSGGVGGPFGVFMNLLAGATLVAASATYYRIERTKIGAIKALLFGIGAMTGVMIVANVLLDPTFFKLPQDTVVALILPALLPFNAVKGAMSSIITYLVYKRVRVHLHELIADRVAW